MESKRSELDFATPRAFKSAVEYRAFKSRGYHINPECFIHEVNKNNDKINTLRARIWKMMNFLDG